MTHTMRERLSEKNGAHKTVFGVLYNKKYEADMRFYHTSSRPQYKTGGRYHGEWVENMKHGYGTRCWVNGSKYEGEWERDARHGKGTYWIKESGGKLRKQYAGDWRGDQRDGIGVFFYADGGRYEGGWMTNRRSGQGLMSYANGEARVYEGEWLDGKRSGAGSLRLPGGDIFEGHWLLDKKEGPGRFLYMSTRKVYDGEWVGGTPKCGEYQDMPPALVDRTVPDGSFPLPALTLKRSGAVLNEVVAVIRNDRARRHGQPGRVFTSDEMDTLRDSFAAFDRSGEGLVPASALQEVLKHAWIHVDPAEVEALLDELQAEPDTAISLPEMTEIVALLLA
ncbi:unnamed protein product [Scytosiphon promiscuus]